VEIILLFCSFIKLEAGAVGETSPSYFRKVLFALVHSRSVTTAPTLTFIFFRKENNKEKRIIVTNIF
jgi:hypothetical protein